MAYLKQTKAQQDYAKDMATYTLFYISHYTVFNLTRWSFKSGQRAVSQHPHGAPFSSFSINPVSLLLKGVFFVAAHNLSVRSEEWAKSVIANFQTYKAKPSAVRESERRRDKRGRKQQRRAWSRESAVKRLALKNRVHVCGFFFSKDALWRAESSMKSGCGLILSAGAGRHNTAVHSVWISSQKNKKSLQLCFPPPLPVQDDIFFNIFFGSALAEKSQEKWGGRGSRKENSTKLLWMIIKVLAEAVQMATKSR